MLYIPGTQVIYTFAVPDADGDNVTGLTFSLTSFTKDGVRVTAGAEYLSIAFSEDASGLFYKCVVTPASSSSAIFGITAKSDAAVPDYFELHLEPDWAKIVLLAEKMVHNMGSTPETITYYLPDGATVVRTFNLTTTGSTETRTGA